MHLKKRMAGLLSAVLLAAVVTGCAAPAQTTASDGEPIIVASYTQGDIKQDELYKQLIAKSGMQTMLEMVDEAILNEVEPATDEMKASVEENLANIKDYYKEDFESSLKASGFRDEAEFKNSMLLNLQRNAYILKYIGAEMITDEEVQAYYDNFSPNIEASHILIKPEAQTEEALAAAEKQAKDLIARINQGEDFAELAKEFSADPGSGAQGGVLGSFGKGQMVPEFEEAAFGLENDQVTAEPVQTQFGFHIIKRTGGEEKKAFEDMKPEILDALAQAKLQADQSLTYRALIQLREDNGFTITNDVIAPQYETFADQVKKQTDQAGGN